MKKDLMKVLRKKAKIKNKFQLLNIIGQENLEKARNSEITFTHNKQVISVCFNSDMILTEVFIRENS